MIGYGQEKHRLSVSVLLSKNALQPIVALLLNIFFHEHFLIWFHNACRCSLLYWMQLLIQLSKHHSVHDVMALFSVLDVVALVSYEIGCEMEKNWGVLSIRH